MDSHGQEHDMTGNIKIKMNQTNYNSKKVTDPHVNSKKLLSEKVNDGSVLAISNYVDNGIICSQQDN